MIVMKWPKAPGSLLKNRLLLENSQEMILFFDKKGRITQCSRKARLELGYGDDIFHVPIGLIFKEAFAYEASRFKIDEKFLDCIRETVACRVNQTSFAVDLKIILGKKKNRRVGICTAVSVEEKKQTAREINDLKKELYHNNQVNREIVAKVAHELRTPLNGIMGFANNLMEMDLRPNQREAVNFINKCSNNISCLINDLMDYSVLNSQTMTIEAEEFSLTELIHNIVDFNIGSINEKGLKLLVYVGNDIPDRLVGDERRLAQILNNLFSNAIKFTMAGQVSLEVMKVFQSENEIELLFMLIDTGIGIDRKDMDKLFHSFSQVDSSINRKYGGTGLGLSICKIIVEAMKGTITVDSEKNKGSTFSFTVCLGISPQSGIFISESDGKKFPVDQEDGEEIIQEQDISDLDYVSKRLEAINANEKEQSNPPEADDFIDINNLMENLTICIELENWEKAEQLAGRLKCLLPKYQNLNSKEIFRLLFAIRRENHDLSLSIINELRIHNARR